MTAEKDQEKKKNIFEKIGDALSSRDEKAAEEAAKIAAEEAARKAAEEAAQKKESEARIAAAKEQIRMQREAQEQRQKAEEAKKLAEEAAAKKLAEEKLAREKAEAQARIEAQKSVKPSPRADVDGRDIKFVKPSPAPEPVLAKYIIKEGDTLSGIAQKHYGHSTRDYWMVIYEANKGVIGNNPGLIRPGVELTIPVLPADLKKD